MPPFSRLHLFRAITTGAAVWEMVGVPVAAIIAAFRVFVYVIYALPDMAMTAAVLGSVQGLWLYLTGRPNESQDGHLRWFGAVAGGVLGLLGFPPVFSRINQIVADRLLVAVSLLAALCGGIAAGFVLTKVVTAPVRRSGSTLGRAVAAGCLVVLPLTAVDYHLYWEPMVDRLPVPEVSRQAVANLSAGNARGSAWAGCYQYLGQFSHGSGVLGKEGGLLKVAQVDGALKANDGNSLLGGVDGDGRFRFGAEMVTGQDTLRVLWEGKFDGNSVEFTKRMTVLRGPTILNTTRLTGTAQRMSCNP
jgi:hypothetical protein